MKRNRQQILLRYERIRNALKQEVGAKVKEYANKVQAGVEACRRHIHCSFFLACFAEAGTSFE